MTDEQRPSDDGFAGTDDTQDEIRRLLAEVRVTDPVPADVAARLDQTLAALQAERAAGRSAGSGAGSSVVPLRQRLGRVLLAAAAVAVLATGGVGLAQVVRDGGSDQASSTTAGGAGAAEDSAAGGSADSGGTADRDGADALSSLAITPALTSARFDADVVQAMRSLAAVGEGALLDSGTVSASPQPAEADSKAGQVPRTFRRGEAPPVTATPLVPDAPSPVTGATSPCPGPDVAGAVTVPATLDGAPVALVFRPPTARAQVVEAWSCDGGSLLRSTTVPH